MDFDDFRSVLQNSGIDVWTFIDTAIGVCVADYADELKTRRDGIVERLYTPSNLDISPRCKNCDHVLVHRSSSDGHVAAVVDEKKSCLVGVAKIGGVSPQSVEIDEDDDDEKDIGYEDLFDDDEQTKILTIKEHLEDPQQSEESLVELLQTLADMDLTFKALKDSDGDLLPFVLDALNESSNPPFTGIELDHSDSGRDAL